MYHPIQATIPRLYLDILQQPHTLIAGVTGSGKSVVINGLIYSSFFTPESGGLLLIDPKRVELYKYRHLKNVYQYSSEPREIENAINTAVRLMEKRYRTMQRKNQVKTDEPPLYIFVDEFADLMTTQKRAVLAPLCRLAQLGRAAGVHLILATQRPTRDIIPGQIKVNVDCRLALRCPTAQDSRNIINRSGAELLPRYGYGYYLTPDTMQPVPVEIPMIQEEDIQKIIECYNKPWYHF